MMMMMRGTRGRGGRGRGRGRGLPYWEELIKDSTISHMKLASFTSSLRFAAGKYCMAFFKCSS